MARHYVYLIFAGQTGAVKVGYSANPETRLSTLQTGSPHALSLGFAFMWSTELEARRAEREVHRACADARIRGEWFEEAPVLEFVDRKQHSWVEDCRLSEFWCDSLGGEACLVSER